MNNGQDDFILAELQQQTNGTTIIEEMKEELDAILLNAEGGLKKRLMTPMTSTRFKVLEAFFKTGLPTLPLGWFSLASAARCASHHPILQRKTGTSKSRRRM